MKNMPKEKDKLNIINCYLDKYFDNRIIADINILLKKEDGMLSFTIPYLLLVNAGIDFLGGLKMGFEKNNSKARTFYFINTWMAKENSLYAFKGIDSFIYDSVRNGITHQAIFKRDVESYKAFACNDKHLFVRRDVDGNKRIFFHTKQFIDDFLKTYQRFREVLELNNDIDAMYFRLFPQTNTTNSSHTDLIAGLEMDGKIFEEELNPSPSAAPPEESE